MFPLGGKDAAVIIIVEFLLSKNSKAKNRQDADF